MPNRTILIHAGLAKAGSTTIQTFLSDNEDRLRSLGVHYPSIGRPGKAHQQIAREIGEGGNFDPRHGTYAQLVEEWRSVGEGTLVISSEFLEEAEEHQIARFKELATGPDDRLQALLVLRNVSDLVTSGYAQRIKHGRKAFDFDQFFDASMAGARTQHFETIGRWAGQFGWENVQLRVLDRQHLVNGDLLDDLLTLLDVDEAEWPGLPRPGTVNAAPGWQTLEAIRAIFSGEHGLPRDHPLADAADQPVGKRKVIGREAARITERLGWSSERGHYLTLDQAQRCHEIQVANVTALNERLPTPLPMPTAPTADTFTAREFLPDASHLPAEQLRELYDELAASERRGGDRGEKAGRKKMKASR